MTVQVRHSTTASPPDGRAPGPPRWLLVAVVMAGVLTLTDAVSQAVTPYIRRDDWPYLLPPDTPTAAGVVAKNLLEGRWLNSAWWYVIGQHSTAASAAVTYAAAYALFVAGLWRVVRLRLPQLHWAVDALLGLALFVSVVWVRLLYWPGTLTPSVLLAATGVWTLPAAARSRRRLGTWLLVVTVLSVLSYPPVGILLFVCAVVLVGVRPWRDLALLAASFIASYAVGIAVIYVLNKIAFDHFGLRIAAWRHPNPLVSLYDAKVNTLRVLRALYRLGVVVWAAGLVGVAASVVAYLDAGLRPALVRLWFAVAVVVGLGSAQTLVTGIDTDPRGELWAWLAIVLPAALLLAGSGWSPRIGVACLAVLAVVGVVTWRSDVGDHQASRREYSALVQQATQPRPDGSRPQVVLYQPAKERNTTRGRITAGTVRMMMRAAQDGVVPRWCTAAECRRIAAARRSVVDLGTVVGVVVPPPPARL
jgi:hypothetical protein